MQKKRDGFTVILAMAMVFQLIALIQASCHCDTADGIDCHPSECDCNIPFETTHCSETCPCPVCCEIDGMILDLSKSPAVITNPTNLSLHAVVTPAENSERLAGNLRMQPERTVTEPVRFHGAGLFQHICVFLI